MSEYRKELKYFLRNTDMGQIKTNLNYIMKIDNNCKNGKYTISSIYLETYNDTSYNQVINGLSERWKYRIRFYDYNDKFIKLEKKYKVNNLTKKSAIKLSKDDFERIMNNTLKVKKSNPELLNEIAIKMKTELLRPAILIEYDRIPYTYKAGNVRITIDYNIRYSRNYNKAFEQENKKHYLKYKILEVKYDEFIPDFIRYKIEVNHLEQTAFSKYFMCMSELKMRGE